MERCASWNKDADEEKLTHLHVLIRRLLSIYNKGDDDDHNHSTIFLIYQNANTLVVRLFPGELYY
jgi:hypothetical protein